MAQKNNAKGQQIKTILDASIQQGYKSAQIYYGQLKQRFIKQIQNSLSISAQQIITEGQKKVEELIVQGGNSISNTKKDRDARLNAILNEFAEQLLLEPSVSSALTEARNKIEKLKQQTNKDETEQTKAIIANTRKAISSLISPKVLRAKFITAIGNYTAGDQLAERYDALIDRIHQFLYYFIKSTLMGKSNYAIYGIPQITLGGYIAEDLEYQNLLTLFSEAAVTPGGTTKITNVAGKTVATEFDNIISNLAFVEANFQKQYSATQEILGSKYMNSLELLSNIQYFGEQVKTFNLSKGRAQQGHRIGEREVLASAARSEGVYSIYDNIRFMSRYKSIISALGPANVLFSTGAVRQWTDDFIRDFRAQGYYLMLQYQSKGRQMVLSNEVILDSPVSMASGTKYKAYRRVRLR